MKDARPSCVARLTVNENPSQINNANFPDSTLGNVADNNENYGIGIFTRTDLGAPTPTGNLIQGNSALGNGRADLLEVLFDPFDIPRESIQPCMNTWMGNAFVSQIGPVMCIE